MLVVVTIPVEVLVALTDAPAIGAPLLSRIVPTRLPLSYWASAALLHGSRAVATNMVVTKRQDFVRMGSTVAVTDDELVNARCARAEDRRADAKPLHADQPACG